MIDVKDVQCPKCHGPMWDERPTKKNPKGPDFKCKDKNCLTDGYKTAVWERDLVKQGVTSAPAPMPQPTTRPVSTTGYSSGPHIPGLDPDAFDPAKLQKLFTVYGLCLDHVLQVEVPKLDRAKIGASPESVGAMTATLLIQASKL